MYCSHEDSTVLFFDDYDAVQQLNLSLLTRTRWQTVEDEKC